MVSQITEIAVFPTGLGETPEKQKEALKVIEGADGWIRAYQGVQIEDPSLGYWIFDWESTDHRAKFLSDDANKPFFAAIAAAAAQSPAKAKAGSLQVLLDPPQPTAVLGAPVTEITVGTLKPGADRARFEGIIRALCEGVSGAKGALGSAWGRVIDDENKYVFVIGWESTEAHQEAVAASGELAAKTHEEMQALSEYEMKHAKLERHEKAA